MRKCKKKESDGFTLIEIIVVLVILAILAAATVPAMLGFVGDARGKAYAAEARLGLTAAQAVITEVVGTNPGVTVDKDGNFGEDTVIVSGDSIVGVLKHPTFKTMVEDCTADSTFSDLVVDEEKNRATGITYEVGKYKITISSSGAVVTQE